MRIAVQPDLLEVVGAEGEAVILWPRVNRYIAVSQSAAQVLRVAARLDGHTKSAVSLRARSDYGLALANVEGALRELEAIGLILTFDEKRGLHPPFTLVVQAALCNVLARLMLAVGKSRLLIELASGANDPSLTSDEGAIWSDLRSERAIAALRLASAFPGVDLDCLPAAVGLWLLLRIQGERPRLRIGALLAPFAAHAWLEVRGKHVDPGATTFHGPRFLPLR